MGPEDMVYRAVGEKASRPDAMNPADQAIRMARRLPAKYYELLEAYLGLDGRDERSILDLAKARKVTRATIVDELEKATHLVKMALGFDNEYLPGDVHDLLIVGAMREKASGEPF